ncbi:MAG: cold shock domain-containing protein [Sedimentisphaerales bacterium]|nr:cold shock domain-containing protein [Sedimentisphaerales bacterium]
MEGTVKWFDKKKGYGFIDGQGGPDIFIHYTSFVQDGLRTLDEGDRVLFEIAQGEKGMRAQNVSLAPAGDKAQSGESD